MTTLNYNQLQDLIAAVTGEKKYMLEDDGDYINIYFDVVADQLAYSNGDAVACITRFLADNDFELETEAHNKCLIDYIIELVADSGDYYLTPYFNHSYYVGPHDFLCISTGELEIHFKSYELIDDDVVLTSEQVTSIADATDLVCTKSACYYNVLSVNFALNTIALKADMAEILSDFNQ